MHAPTVAVRAIVHLSRVRTPHNGAVVADARRSADELVATLS